MVENTRVYRTFTPTVSFADREDFRPKRQYHRENYNPYSPLSLQRSRLPLDERDHSVIVGYNIEIKRIDYDVCGGLDLARMGRAIIGFKVDDETRKLFNQWITGKL